MTDAKTEEMHMQSINSYRRAKQEAEGEKKQRPQPDWEPDYTVKTPAELLPLLHDLNAKLED